MTASDGGRKLQTQSDAGPVGLLIRLFGWTSLCVLSAFLINNYLTVWRHWPGATGDGSDALTWIQRALYIAAILGAGLLVFSGRERSLKAERERVFALNNFLIRAAFWSVLLIGTVDASLSFLRGEDLLDGLVGADLALHLTHSDIRGLYIHMPLVALGTVLAALTRGLWVPWLALMIVAIELLIVMFRFVFSYEQLYMTDLLRFWYAALFLFGCAHTLRQEGHVRVDVLYTRFGPKARGWVNAVGSLLLGMPFCWLILIVGTAGRTGIVNSALLTFEIEGLGDGMYILYLMTVFAAVFAVTMLIEFVAQLFGALDELLSAPARSPDTGPVV